MQINYLKNYYEILGVSKDSSAEELKIAHRKKALEFHPDKAKDKSTAQSMFIDIQEAYEVLKDPEARADYDRNYRHPSFDLFRDFVTKNMTVIQIDDYFKQGANVDACNAFNQTLLMFAANRGKLDLVEFLLNNNASIDAVDGAGNTPLMYAAMTEEVIFSIDNAAIIKEKNTKYYESREFNEGDKFPSAPKQRSEDKIASFLISMGLNRVMFKSTNWLMIGMGLDAKTRYKIMLIQKTLSSILILSSHLEALGQLADQVQLVALGTMGGKNEQEPRAQEADEIEFQSPNYLMLMSSVAAANLIPTALSAVLTYYGFDSARIAYISRIERSITIPIIIYHNSGAVYELTTRGADYLYDVLKIEQASSYLRVVFSSVKSVAFETLKYFGVNASKLDPVFERISEVASSIKEQAFKFGEYIGFNKTRGDAPKIKEKVLDENKIRINREKAKIAELLISRNASLLEANNGSKNTLDFAIQYKNIPLMNVLYRHLGLEDKIIPEEEVNLREEAEATIEVYQTDLGTVAKEDENSVQSYYGNKAIDPILLAKKPNQVENVTEINETSSENGIELSDGAEITGTQLLPNANILGRQSSPGTGTILTTGATIAGIQSSSGAADRAIKVGMIGKYSAGANKVVKQSSIVDFLGTHGLSAVKIAGTQLLEAIRDLDVKIGIPGKYNTDYTYNCINELTGIVNTD